MCPQSGAIELNNIGSKIGKIVPCLGLHLKPLAFGGKRN